MAIVQQQSYVAECDGCGNRQLLNEGDVPKGVSGSVSLPDGSSVSWLSCRTNPTHIGKAVLAVLPNTDGAAEVGAGNGHDPDAGPDAWGDVVRSGSAGV